MKPSWPPKIAAGLGALMGLYSAPHLMSCSSHYGIAKLPATWDDLDEDGIPDHQDCAPNDPDIHPYARDYEGDGIDQNCDGVDGVADPTDTRS